MFNHASQEADPLVVSSIRIVTNQILKRFTSSQCAGTTKHVLKPHSFFCSAIPFGTCRSSQYMTLDYSNGALPTPTAL